MDPGDFRERGVDGRVRVSGASPCTRTATRVPNSGFARSTICEHDGMGGQQTAHAVGDVFGRERRAGDVLDAAAVDKRHRLLSCRRIAPAIWDFITSPP